MKPELPIQMQRYFQGGDSRQHFSNIETKELFAIATLLDARYKTRGFSLGENVTIAKELLMGEFYNNTFAIVTSQGNQVNNTTESTSSLKKSSWYPILDSSFLI